MSYEYKWKKPCGLIFGLWYIGLIILVDLDSYSDSVIYLFTSVKNYNKLTKSSSDSDKSTTNKTIIDQRYMRGMVIIIILNMIIWI